MATLGKRIREARENKGLLLTQLAKMIGARSAGVISNWENDLNKPDIDKIIAVCVRLWTFLSVSWLAIPLRMNCLFVIRTTDN